jgi:hypothetical protein
MDGITTDGVNDVALLNASFRGRRILYDVPGGDTAGGIHPGDAIIGENVAGALLEVKDGKNDGSQG